MEAGKRPFIMYLDYEGDTMMVNCYRTLYKVALKEISTALLNATPRQREQYYVARNGESVYFPFLEEEIWMTQILQFGELVY